MGSLCNNIVGPLNFLPAFRVTTKTPYTARGSERNKLCLCECWYV